MWRVPRQPAVSVTLPDTLDLAGRVAIVTGAARGLGQAEAIALAKRGVRVVAVDVLSADETIDLIRGFGGEAMAVEADLVAPEAADAIVEATLRAYGGVHVIVNNAGVVRDRMSYNLSDEDWDIVVAVSLSASFRLARTVVRRWREDGPGDGRVIINTSSESGLYGNRGQANYAAAKAGVAALTITLATELESLGVRVNAIAPRARTPMTTGAFGDLPRTAAFDPFAPEHVAEVVAWLASDAAEGVTGQILVVHGRGIELMRPWSVLRTLDRDRDWTDDDLRGLRDELFPDGAWRQVAAPVSDLFAKPDDRS